MQANYVQRLRVRFSKAGPARYSGHLDLQRTLERTFNRASLPVARTQGFNRRPRMQLASALPLGYTSASELVDIWLTETVASTEVVTKLQNATAPGIAFLSAWEVSL